MPSTNAIRAFADKVRAAHSAKSNSISMNMSEARNLNHEIEVLLALLVEQSSSASTAQDITLEVKSNRW